MFLLLDSKNDIEEASEYCDLIGQDVLWTNLTDLLDAGISEKLISTLLKAPQNNQTIIQVAHELEKIGKLYILSNLVLSNEALTNDPLLLSLKLKLLVEKDEKLFLEIISRAEANDLELILKYCEAKSPKLAIKYYLQIKNASEISRLAFKLEDWNTLSLFLITYKNVSAWAASLENEASPMLFENVLANSDKFQDTESASCLIKALVTKNDSESLLKIMKSWLENNKVLCSSRSLQTLYLIQLIKVRSNLFSTKCLFFFV